MALLPRLHPPVHSGIDSIDVANIFLVPHPDGAWDASKLGKMGFYAGLAHPPLQVMELACPQQCQSEECKLKNGEKNQIW
jgi:hypothetical protein